MGLSSSHGAHSLTVRRSAAATRRSRGLAARTLTRSLASSWAARDEPGLRRRSAAASTADARDARGKERSEPPGVLRPGPSRSSAERSRGKKIENLPSRPRRRVRRPPQRCAPPRGRRNSPGCTRRVLRRTSGPAAQSWAGAGRRRSDAISRSACRSSDNRARGGRAGRRISGATRLQVPCQRSGRRSMNLAVRSS